MMRWRVFSGLAGTFLIIGRTHTKRKIRAKEFLRFVHKTKACKEL
jgi:hypothetical protein